MFTHLVIHVDHIVHTIHFSCNSDRSRLDGLGLGYRQVLHRILKAIVAIALGVLFRALLVVVVFFLRFVLKIKLRFRSACLRG